MTETGLFTGPVFLFGIQPQRLDPAAGAGSYCVLRNLHVTGSAPWLAVRMSANRTIFNRLTRTRDALVADFPGLTRDRKYGSVDDEGLEFIVVDTGGIDGSEEGIELEMAEQSLRAIDEADVVLFMVDARAGATVADTAIADRIT